MGMQPPLEEAPLCGTQGRRTFSRLHLVESKVELQTPHRGLLEIRSTRYADQPNHVSKRSKDERSGAS
jgi:hypothetical protein